MRSIIKELRRFQVLELDKLIFLLESELFKEFNEDSDNRLTIINKMKEDLNESLRNK